MSVKQQAVGGNTQKNPDTWVSGDDPMTGAQASYLETLAEQTHKKVPRENLTKAEASKQIDALKSDLAEVQPRRKAG